MPTSSNVEPFAGYFAERRRALRRIKRATWKRAVSHSAEVMLDGGWPFGMPGGSSPLLGGQPSHAVFSAPIACGICCYSWTANGPDPSEFHDLACPRCGSESGEIDLNYAGEHDEPDALDFP